MSQFPHPDYLGIKICGVTQAQQARDIAGLGADAIGVNFWPNSKRYLDPTGAATWLPELRSQVHLVAVLVNPEADLIDLLMERPLVHTLQLHGDESPELVHSLQERGALVIKALQVRDRASLDAIGNYPCQTVLLDAYNPGVYGGVGHTFPWELAALARELFPDKRILLSGGLTPQNVRQAISETSPAGVDVASGVESSPGIKDLAMVRQFIEEARG